MSSEMNEFSVNYINISELKSNRNDDCKITAKQCFPDDIFFIMMTQHIMILVPGASLQGMVSNHIQQYSVRCNYLSMPCIPLLVSKSSYTQALAITHKCLVFSWNRIQPQYLFIWLVARRVYWHTLPYPQSTPYMQYWNIWYQGWIIIHFPYSSIWTFCNKTAFSTLYCYKTENYIDIL